MTSTYRLLTYLVLSLAATASADAAELLPGNYMLTMTPDSKEHRDKPQRLLVRVMKEKGKLAMLGVEKDVRRNVRFECESTKEGVALKVHTPHVRIECTETRSTRGEFEGTYKAVVTQKGRKIPDALARGKWVLTAYDHAPPREYLESKEAQDKALSEAMIITSLRALATECERYRVEKKEYPTKLGELGKKSYFNTVRARVEKYGYKFEYEKGKRARWSVKAKPTRRGYPHYYLDQTGVLRFNPNGPANQKSAPVE